MTQYFTEHFSLDGTLDVTELEKTAISEGVDVEFKNGKKFVSFNDTHEKGVDTSAKANPTVSSLDVDISNFDIKTVEVYSIFKRVSGNVGDGNSLIFALKDEKNFIFKYGEREKFRNRAKTIIAKFLDDYMKKIGKSFSTIVLPSGKSVNSNFAKLVKEIADKKYAGRTSLYDDVFVKLPVEFIRDSVLLDAGSPFNAWVHSFPKMQSDFICNEFSKNLEMMDIKRNGYFTYHMISNPDIRNMISTSLSVNQDYKPYADNFSPINDKHILILDDMMSRGNTIRDAIKNLCNCYHPLSITVLTLLSRKY